MILQILEDNADLLFNRDVVARTDCERGCHDSSNEAKAQTVSKGLYLSCFVAGFRHFDGYLARAKQKRSIRQVSLRVGGNCEQCQEENPRMNFMGVPFVSKLIG